MKQYILRVLIAIDQLFNTVADGYPDETISARCWRLRSRQPYTLFRAIVDGLFYVGHCQSAYESELAHNQSPPEERA